MAERTLPLCGHGTQKRSKWGAPASFKAAATRVAACLAARRPVASVSGRPGHEIPSRARSRRSRARQGGRPSPGLEWPRRASRPGPARATAKLQRPAARQAGGSLNPCEGGRGSCDAQSKVPHAPHQWPRTHARGYICPARRRAEPSATIACRAQPPRATSSTNRSS
jgi:hypothetical protein